MVDSKVVMLMEKSLLQESISLHLDIMIGCKSERSLETGVRAEDVT